MVFKPRLRDFSFMELIATSQSNHDAELDSEIRKIIMSKFYEMHLDYRTCYKMYKKSHGLQKEVLTDALITFLEQDSYFIEEDIADELLCSASLDHVWCLSNDAQNPMIKNKALDLVLEAIDQSLINGKFKMRLQAFRHKANHSLNKIKIMKRGNKYDKY